MPPLAPGEPREGAVVADPSLTWIDYQASGGPGGRSPAARAAGVAVIYTSGLEPCFVLDSVVVRRGLGTIAITVIEGHTPGSGGCRLVAVTKRTEVDLGELAPGTYVISDSGHAPTVDITID